MKTLNIGDIIATKLYKFTCTMVIFAKKKDLFYLYFMYKGYAYHLRVCLLVCGKELWKNKVDKYTIGTVQTHPFQKIILINQLQKCCAGIVSLASKSNHKQYRYLLIKMYTTIACTLASDIALGWSYKKGQHIRYDIFFITCSTFYFLFYVRYYLKTLY